MALPTPDTLYTLQISADGSPYCDIAATSGIELDTLQISYDGSPFWGTEIPVVTTTTTAAPTTTTTTAAPDEPQAHKISIGLSLGIC